MAKTRTLVLPDLGAIAASLSGNPIRQLSLASRVFNGTTTPWERRGTHGELVTGADSQTLLLVPKRVKPTPGLDAILVVPSERLVALQADDHAELDLRSCQWWMPRPNSDTPATSESWRVLREDIRQSWLNRLNIREERRDGAGTVVQTGLRSPQVGALHAVLAHWTVTHEPATVVMPTGTGKTETMLATLVYSQPTCLLVVVPTDALREQVSRKFMSLGVLPQLGVLNGPVKLPVVGTLKRRPLSSDEVVTLFSRCNVVVTTMAVAGSCSEAVQQAMADAASHLIIDEAHHISARTWASFRTRFLAKPILQFTATPFRRDRKHVDGRVIYNYPLRKAQDEGLFQRVNFRPVFEFGALDDADRAVASLSLEQLTTDLEAGHDHLALARCDSIERANAVAEVYRELDKGRVAAGKQAVGLALVHSRMGAGERRTEMFKLQSRVARVVVCVDMFGEGFDMPELKVAALHDVHKSLAITLQFVGRFTRSSQALGEATVVVNLGRAQVEESLRALYAEDADWNVVLRDLSTGANARQTKRAEFLRKFEPPPITIPLQNLSPAMSTVAYSTKCDEWLPDALATAIGDDRIYGLPSVNHEDKVAVFVTREINPVQWGDIREIADTTWDLYLVHWDSDAQLLYICSSNNQSMHRELAHAVAGKDAELIRGETMFRVFHDVRRLMLLNLGLRHAIGHNIQFTMYVGADVLANLPTAAQATKVKSNMFGHGFEAGHRASYGCSYKGRVWSHRRAADIVEWMEWARLVGAKLKDATIDTASALRYALVPKRAASRPSSVPFAIQWPHDFLLRPEEMIHFAVDGKRTPLLHVGIELTAHESVGALTFRVYGETFGAQYKVEFAEQGVSFVHIGGEAIAVTSGRRTTALTELLNENGPPIYFVDGSSLFGDTLLSLPNGYFAPFDRQRIEVADWTGVDIQRESQGAAKDAATVQRRTIEFILASEPAPSIVFDDDAAGEAADVVVLRADANLLRVQLYHCKFSSASEPGGRIADLYTVCGQAQTSAFWKGAIDRLLAHIDRREAQRIKGGGPSRFERGDVAELRAIRRKVDSLVPIVEVVIVQPGLSRQKASPDQLNLLSVTELYLEETYKVPLRVLGSD